MSRYMLVTRPRYDELTEYLYSWSEYVLELTRRKRFQILDLVGAKAERRRFESYIREHFPPFVFLNGHGNSIQIAGHNEVIVDRTSKLTNSIVYARSCDSAMILGSKLVKNGAKAFIGYTRKYIFAYFPHTKWLEKQLASLENDFGLNEFTQNIEKMSLKEKLEVHHQIVKKLDRFMSDNSIMRQELIDDPWSVVHEDYYVFNPMRFGWDELKR